MWGPVTALWWACSVGSGMVMGIAVGLVGVFVSRAKDDAWHNVPIVSLAGLVLGCVCGYIMGWLGPVLPNWPTRFAGAALVGALCSSSMVTDRNRAALCIAAALGGWTGALAALLVCVVLQR